MNQLRTAKPQLVKCLSVLERLNTPIVRSCVLNLVAQIATGTPMAARDFPRHSYPPSNMRSEGPGTLKNDVRLSRTPTSLTDRYAQISG
jgi:hypothetical protein